MMLAYARNWWALAIRGALALLFGILTLLAPSVSLQFLVALFGAFALADGVLAVAGALQAWRGDRGWGMLLVAGLTGISIGAFTLRAPDVTVLTLIVLIAAWALISGAFAIWAARHLRREMQQEWLLALSGVASMVVGGVMIVYPEASAIVLTRLVGVYAVALGLASVALALRLRAAIGLVVTQPTRGHH